MKFPKEEKFDEFLIKQYLKYGSVDEAFRANRYSLPISFASYHRLVEKWGIVKAAGPNNQLNEALEFFSHLADGNHSFEKLYSKMPPSFKTSAVTLYRILSYIKEGITRRMGTALILTPYNSDEKILIAKDISTPRIELGKPFGSITVPTGFSKKRDTREEAILRVLQQEVFTGHAIKRNMPDIIPDNPKPFMYLDVADVRVEIFHIKLPKALSTKNSFSSFKLCEYRFLSEEKIIQGSLENHNFRVGVKGAVEGFQKYKDLLSRNLEANPFFEKSQLNYQLAIASGGYR